MVTVVERPSGFRWVLALCCTLWIGCSEDTATPGASSNGSGSKAPAVMPESPPSAETPDPSSAVAQVPERLSPEEMIEAGRSVYNANCIACHSVDPTQDGALGPAVAGSSLTLLEARVLRAEYPEGYEPNRKTRVMVALPHLEPRLPELAAYLDSPD